MSRALRHRPALLAAIVTALIAAVTPAGLTATATATAAVPPKVSYTEMLNDFMCIACHESLAVAQSPESFSERQYLRTLIAQGDSRQQIERSMVAAYGSAVLAVPPAHGFNLLVYVIPPILLAIGVVTVAITLPRWRRRTAGARAPAPPPAPAAALAAEDARRLNEDLARRA